MTKFQNTKLYDLEERTFKFARDVAVSIRKLPRNISNLEYGNQAVDASGSTGGIFSSILIRSNELGIRN